jgi:predicted DNA-binding ribbon-helix-helix protein
MKSLVIKRSIVIAGHKTSVSLEDAFWRGLKEIAIGRDKTLSDLVAEIDTGRPHNNLSSAIRLFVLDHYRAQTNGHAAESTRHQFYGRNKRLSGGAPISSARTGC